MADSIYTQYHSSLLSTQAASAPQAHQSRKAVFARLAQPFIGTSRPPSSSGNGPAMGSGGSGGGPGSVTSAPTNLLNPRNMKYNLQSPILSLAANTEGDRVVVAGREILRILRVESNEFTESANLRAPGDQKKHFQCHVKWGCMTSKNIIATAGTNGTICLYDIKEGKLDRMFREHGRQVHRLAFNTANGNLLLSASQDGTMKLFDMREVKSVHTYQGKAEAVRDVQFNAGNATEFAAAFDSGAIQRWDFRNNTIYERKINAHNGPAFTIDWHPDGKYCASGGRDKTVKVWDFNADARRKPKHTLTTIAPANNLSWRPSRNSKLDTTQIATCAFNTDHRVQIWDFKRPYVPVRTLDVHDNVTTGILWKDEDILWSCSRDSTLVQSDVPFAPQQINSMTYTALSWSPEGDFTFVGQRRGKNRQHATSGSRSTFETDEDISNREERRSHGRHNSFKSSKPILNINIFDTAFEKYVPAQSSAKVSIASVFDKEAFDFMAQLYVIDLDGIAGGRRITLAQACEMNYRVATKAHKYRTAKSWQAIKCIVLSEDAAAEKAARKPLPDLFSAHHINSMVARKAIGFDTGGDLSVNASGGTTPMPSRSPRTVATTPTPKKAGEFAEPPLRLPPAAFGRSPSSSTFSTDGDDSAAERLAAAFAGSDSDAPRKLMRLNLTIETNGSSFKAQDFTFQNGDGTNGVNKHTRAQLSVDENQLYPLLTSTTDRSDPLETSMSFKMPTAFVDIGSANAMHHQSQLSQTMALPLSPTTQDDNSFDSPSLGRQFSLVSEQTDSSYGVLGGRSSDMSDSESPHNLGGQTGMYSLPPITEEKTMPPTPWPQANTPARVPSALAYDYSQREEKPWSSRRFVDKIITHSTTHGDVQLAATLILLLHKRIEFTQDLVEEVLDGYLMLLTRLRHFSTAALVRKLAPSETMRMTGQFNVDVDLSCGFCGRAVGGRGGGWCQKCTGKGGAECVICGQVGKGRWTVCAECGHGGCEGCMRGWFLEGEEGEGEGEGDGEGVQGSVQEAVEGDERCAAVGCPCVCLPRKQNES